MFATSFFKESKMASWCHRRAQERVPPPWKACDHAAILQELGVFGAYKQLSKRRCSRASGAQTSNNKQALASVV
jgi:hypothetical protein